MSVGRASSSCSPTRDDSSEARASKSMASPLVLLVKEDCTSSRLSSSCSSSLLAASVISADVWRMRSIRACDGAWMCALLLLLLPFDFLLTPRPAVVDDRCSLIRSAYRSVFNEWSVADAPGLTVAIMVVLLSGSVKQSLSNNVSLD